MEERPVPALVGRVDPERVDRVRRASSCRSCRRAGRVSGPASSGTAGRRSAAHSVCSFRVDVEEMAVSRQRRAEVRCRAPRDRCRAVQPGDAPAHERGGDRQSAEAARHPNRWHVERIDGNLDAPAQAERRLHEPGLVADQRVANRRPRVVDVRRQVTFLQRVDRVSTVDLGQVHVTEGRLHVSDHRVLSDDLLALADDGDDVEVLEDALVALVLAGVDVQRRRAEVVRNPADHRIDRRSVGRGDVDSLMEREEAGTVEAACEHAVLVHRARIAEEAADRMLLVERLERPAVRRRGARRGERQRRHDGYKSKQAHQRDIGMMGRPEDAAVRLSR